MVIIITKKKVHLIDFRFTKNNNNKICYPMFLSLFVLRVVIIVTCLCVTNAPK